MGPASLLFGVTGGFPAFHLHPDVWLVVAALVVSYWWAITRLGPRIVPAGEQIVSRGNIVCYSFAVLTLWIFAEWPLHDLAEHYLFSVHMLQHLVFTTVSAPLMLLGLPPWLMRRLLVTPRRIYVVARHVTRPVPGAFLVFSSGVVYNAYVGRPELLGFSAISDQQTAGAIMKIGGGAVLWGILVYTFFKWVGEEQRRDEAERVARRARALAAASSPQGDMLPETLTWDDVARELERVPPPRAPD